MSVFLSRLVDEELDAAEIARLSLDADTDWFRLTQPLAYRSSLHAAADPKGDGIIIAPAGFITDYASTPRLFWVLIPPEDTHYTRAAVIHDWIYNQHLFPKAQCDAIFREAMLCLSLSPFTAWLMFEAVHLCGAGAYAAERPQPCLNL